MDSKGYDISVCDQHKSIHELFCSYCNVALCRQCISGHRGHEIIPIREKCAETRKEVFKYINDFDLLTKDVKFQQQLQKDCLAALDEAASFCRPETIVDVFVEMMSEKVREITINKENRERIDGLCSRFSEHRDSILKKSKTDQIDQIVSEADTMGNNLRELLQNSDGMLVNKFSDIIIPINDSLKKQRNYLKTVVSFRPFHIKDEGFHELAQKCVSYLLDSAVWPAANFCDLGDLRLPSVSKEIPESKVVFAPNGSCFLINSLTEEKGSGSKAFSIASYENVSAIFSSSRGMRPFRASCRGRYSRSGRTGRHRDLITYTPPFRGGSHSPDVLPNFLFGFDHYKGTLNFESSTIHEIRSLFYSPELNFDRLCDCFVACSKSATYIVKVSSEDIEKTPGPEGLHPAKALMFYVSGISGEVNCLVYQDTVKKICSFFDDGSFVDVSCPTKPALICCNNEMSQLFAKLEESNDILVLTKGHSVTISACQHGLRSVDSLNFFTDTRNATNYLLAWNYAQRICVVFEAIISELNIVGAVSPAQQLSCVENNSIINVEVVNPTKKNSDSLLYVYTGGKNRVRLWKISMEDFLASLKPEFVS